MKIGILGAGFIGGALAKLATDRGHDVMISSRHPETLADQTTRIGSKVGSLDQAAAFGAICILAIPLLARDSIPAAALAGKVVIDAMNYYPHRDGAIAVLEKYRTTTSELVSALLPGVRLVKAFNAILARDLPDGARPPIATGRRALPVAGDDPEAIEVVAALHDAFGFDVVKTGSLADSWRFERAKPAYCVPLDRVGLQRALDEAVRDKEQPDGSWRN